MPTVADECLLRFASQFLDGIQASPGEGALSREMDNLSFACLLLCIEHGVTLSWNPSAILTRSRDAAYGRGFTGSYDLYPWALALEAVNGKINNESIMIDRLVENLVHGNSGIRGYMLELGWFVRRWLPVDRVVPLLLKNVADTIFDWTFSLGLCSVLFNSKDEFWEYADAYVPNDDDIYIKQYQDRLQLVRDDGLGICLCDLYYLDLSIRKLVEETALVLRCHK